MIIKLKPGRIVGGDLMKGDQGEGEVAGGGAVRNSILKTGKRRHQGPGAVWNVEGGQHLILPCSPLSLQSRWVTCHLTSMCGILHLGCFTLGLTNP